VPPILVDGQRPKIVLDSPPALHHGEQSAVISLSNVGVIDEIERPREIGRKSHTASLRSGVNKAAAQRTSCNRALGRGD
jgi:hypothetical protein